MKLKWHLHPFKMKQLSWLQAATLPTPSMLADGTWAQCKNSKVHLKYKLSSSVVLITLLLPDGLIP